LGKEYIYGYIQEITVCSQSYKIPLHLATFATFALLESRRESTCRWNFQVASDSLENTLEPHKQHKAAVQKLLSQIRKICQWPH